MSAKPRLALLLVVALLFIPRLAVAGEPSPVQAPTPSDGSRTRVYIFDGLNPLGLARVNRLADRVRESGLPQTQVVRWNSAWKVEQEIRASYASDPDIQVALVGYSAGTYAARRLANRLLSSGVPVAVVGYVGGDYLSDTPSTRVSGAGRVVNVTGDGYLLTGRNLFFNGTQVSGAVNVRLGGTRHYGLPTHPTTVATLLDALSSVPTGSGAEAPGPRVNGGVSR
jgi:hypothetical protein